MAPALPVLMLAAACGLTVHSGRSTAEPAAHPVDGVHPAHVPLARADIHSTRIDWRQAQDAPARRPDPRRDSRPVEARGSWTQFLGSVIDGNAEEDAKFGGKLNASLAIDGKALRLWRGFTINVGGEFVFGSSVNQSGAGTLLPPNIAMMFPASGREDYDIALNFTQRFGGSSLTFGKINMVETVERTPLISGGGLEGFQHGALATPPSELTPPWIFGALWSRPSPRAALTVGAWDVTSALNRTGLSAPFSDGIAGMTAVTVPVRLGGRPGYHGFTVMATSKRGLNLEDIGDLLLPPESEQIPGLRRGGWFVKYGAQQFLWQDPANPARGWGLFGHIGAWDANPTPMQWSATVGVGGSPPIAARPRDRFGLGYFRSSFSRTLRDGLEPILILDDEQGMEAFYTAEVIRRLRVTGHVQLIDSAVRGVDRAVLIGLRTRVILD